MWLTERPARADIQLPDDGSSGIVQMWAVEGFGKVPVPTEQVGLFDSTKVRIRTASPG
jgi:hypothetical protein